MGIVDPTAHFQQFGSGISHNHNFDEGEFLPIIHILGEEQREMRNLGIERLKLKIKLLNPPQREDNNITEYNRVLSGWLDRAFTALLQTIESRLNVRPSDKVGIKFIRGDYDSFSLSFRRFDQYSSNVIIAAISRILQSNSEFLYDENLVVEATHIRSDIGCGKTYRLEGCSTEKFAEVHKKSVFQIKTPNGKENFCLAYAILLGIAHVEKDINTFNSLLYPPNIEQYTQKALQLCEDANVDLSYGGGIEEIKQFQKYFASKYNIIVFSDRKGRSLFFRGHKDDSIKKIYLLLENQHYLLITSIHAAFSVNFYCDQCLKSSNMKMCHRDCPYTCSQCYSKPPCYITENKLYCNKCNRTFYGIHCFSKHINARVCDKFKVCSKCFIYYFVKNRNEKSHVCGMKYCLVCKCDRKISHDCFIPPIEMIDDRIESENGSENNKKRKQILFVFYDFETVQNTLLPGATNKFEHSVNLAIAQQVCEHCEVKEDINDDCENCGKRMHIFMGEKSLDMFMRYLTDSIDSKFKKVICIAHFMKGFDGQFCLRYIYQNNEKWGLNEKSLIINGTKIMRIAVGRYIFLDSLNYLCSPLSALPKMFNIKYKKGYFPHLFHTRENIDYVGKYPDTKFYDCDTMSTNERKEFLKWYDQKIKSNAVFNLRYELIFYCKIDVDILRIACMRFRSILIKNTNVDPFNGPVTIASTCMTVFRSMCLKPNTIALIPQNGYRRIDNQSIKAIKWLNWLMYKNQIHIQTAENGREYRLPINIKVDGFCESTNTVYEFLGSSTFHF